MWRSNATLGRGGAGPRDEAQEAMAPWPRREIRNQLAVLPLAQLVPTPNRVHEVLVGSRRHPGTPGDRHSETGGATPSTGFSR